MGRTRWLAALLGVALAIGALERLRWPSSAPALDCAVEKVGLVRQKGTELAACGPLPGMHPLPVAWARTLGQKLPLNQLGPEELASIPGIGKRLGNALVSARSRSKGFQSWDEVAQVHGVGPAKLKLLQDVASLEP